MNDLEKRSFYSFLSLYIISSFFFISLIGYLYYSVQKDALENATYYKLQHFSDSVSGEIIMAHMQNKPLKKIFIPDGIELVLVNTKGMVIKGKMVEPFMQKKVGYFSAKGYEIYISDGPKEHLDIAYVIAQTDTLVKEIAALKSKVLQSLSIVSFFIVIIAVILSKIFMKPVRQRVEQIERFINDVTHELNTPITSLSMATDQALKQGECTQKTLTNISISTKQLYDIYRSLTYLNFSNEKDIAEPIDLEETLTQIIEYHRPLAEIKRMTFEVTLESLVIAMPSSQATLLFSNLIGNAIKYSSAKSTIVIELKDKVFSIRDEGIGIALNEQKDIFKKFKRATAYSGGFGVGLNIVKSICDEYGIKIEVDSVPGEGTEFRLIF